MAFRIEDILQLYKTRGALVREGEEVTHLEHALQCARLAEEARCSDELVIACFLHDVGHLLVTRTGAAAAPDDMHAQLAAVVLRDLFPAAVLEPIKLHVEAKRFLCFSEPGYYESLSFASERSLKLQGGALDAAAARHFLLRPHAEDAVVLRRLDDLAKDPDRAAPPLGHYESLMRASILQPA